MSSTERETLRERLVREGRGLAGEIGTHALNQVQMHGFDEAARVLLGTVDRRVVELETKMRTPVRLTKDEQLVLATLKDLRDEMTDDIAVYFGEPSQR